MCLYSSCVCFFKSICLMETHHTEWTQLSWKMEQEVCHISAMRHSFIIYLVIYWLSFSYDFAGLQQINLNPLPFGMLCAFKHFGNGISVNNLPSWHQVDHCGYWRYLKTNNRANNRRECCQFCFRCDCKRCFQLCSSLESCCSEAEKQHKYSQAPVSNITSQR